MTAKSSARALDEHCEPGANRLFKGVTIPRRIHNLALIGFMGTGKSSVGRQIADVLRFSFLDTDQEIESKAGKSVSDIFQQDGEPAFRDWEKRIVQELTARDKTVIATGGGLAANETNLASLKSHALVVCLWASAETIFERVQSHTHRPLLQETEPLAKIKSLLAARAPYYRQADVLVNTEMRSVREVAAQVAHQFHLAQAAHR